MSIAEGASIHESRFNSLASSLSASCNSSTTSFSCSPLSLRCLWLCLCRRLSRSPSSEYLLRFDLCLSAPRESRGASNFDGNYIDVHALIFDRLDVYQGASLPPYRHLCSVGSCRVGTTRKDRSPTSQAESLPRNRVLQVREKEAASSISSCKQCVETLLSA